MDGGEYLNRYLLQLINSYLKQNKISEWKISYVISVYEKGVGKILRIIEELVSIISSADYLPRLSTINCRKAQSTLLARIKIISIQIEDLWIIYL